MNQTTKQPNNQTTKQPTPCPIPYSRHATAISTSVLMYRCYHKKGKYVSSFLANNSTIPKSTKNKKPLQNMSFLLHTNDTKIKNPKSWMIRGYRVRSLENRSRIIVVARRLATLCIEETKFITYLYH